ncbi:hypothetical protein FLSI110296_04400 [Flavobacterium sinopsychrotolerans]|uniref:Right handed beta helix region n=1 Tax=Flavobacterium sinopsychrotolerans TaxID=604089 RepID=A0A1H8MUK0_9FLAO|nr:hypothetical protein [Flavobacterium sinopsychrotolerans]SEO20949.1 Right handed beta helix region [Flavobacterium sinopsychrotolerans]
MSSKRVSKILNSLIALFFITSVYSQGVTVTSLLDDGSVGTLRWAITAANLDNNINEIDFTIGFSGTLTLTSNLPTITSNLTIIGPGVSNLIVSGNTQYSMFNVVGGSVLTLSGITFSNNASYNGSIFRADNSYSSVVASSINVTSNARNYAFYTNSNSSITISNSTFANNSGTLFGSDYGSAPNITSDIETDYTNRITVTGSTFDANTGIIFYTERYVKIDNCVFTANTQQIGYFRGVNRYQVLNSTFTNNTGGTLFSFSSWIGDTPSFGEGTLGTNNTLFQGNTFTGNTGTIINPGGSSKYDSKTAIINNIFINNGTSYTGTPAVIINNTLDNFISAVTHSVTESTLIVTMKRPVFNTNTGSGTLEVSDFELGISGGNATLISSIPTSISANGNIYTLGIALSGEISGAEMITVKPSTNSIYDGSFNVAGTSQQNNSIYLNFLDDDADGISNFSDLCPNTLPGVRVYSYNGCEDTTYPFITHFNYGATLNYPSNFVLTTNHTLYFTSYDPNWNSSINKLTPEKVLSTLFTPINADIQSLTADTSDNLYFVYYDYITNSSEIRKITPNGATSVLLSVSQGYLDNLTTDTSGNLYFIQNSASGDLRELKKMAADGTETVLTSDNNGYFQNLMVDSFGNIYFVFNNNNTNSRIIKKITADGSVSELYSTNDYIQNLKIDNLGNIYFVNQDSNNNTYQINKLISTGIVSNLYIYGTNVYPQSIAIDAMSNLYFATYDSNIGKSQINSITPEGIIVSYGEYTGNELYNDRNGTIYFNDNLNKKIMTNKIVQPTATLSNFDAITKYYFDGSFTITPPNTDSTGAFSYVSSDTNVATISGTTVTIVAAGVSTITATQDADATHLSNTISADLNVNAVTVVTKNGEITNIKPNYVNKNGAIGTSSGVGVNGEIKLTKTSSITLFTQVTIPFEEYFDLEAGSLCGGSCFDIVTSNYDLVFAAGGGTVRARMWWNNQYTDMAMVYDKSFDNLTSVDIANYYYCDYIGDPNLSCINVDTPPTDFVGIYHTNSGNYYAVQYLSEDTSGVTFKYKRLN